MTVTLPMPERLAARIQEDKPLAAQTTLRIGGPARFYLEARSLRDVSEAISAAQEAELPLHVLGGGSNLLIDDAGVDGLVLSLGGLKRIAPYGSKVFVQAGATLSGVVGACVKAGIAGPEGLAGIPGSVGGALAMNAGGRYGEICDLLERIVWINPRGELESLYREEIAFGYRESSLRNGVVLEAVLQGTAGDARDLAAKARQIMAEKTSAQPYAEFSAGCTFKNPKELSAGRLIDQAGCKGLTIGGARVSLRHGNFIVNTGGASFSDVTGLIEEVREQVLKSSGILLETEVQVWPRKAA